MSVFIANKLITLCTFVVLLGFICPYGPERKSGLTRLEKNSI